MTRTTVPAHDAPEQADGEDGAEDGADEGSTDPERLRLPVTTRIPMTWSPTVRPLIHQAAVR